MKNIQRENWAGYLVRFNKRNQSRPTWLQVFGEAGAQSEALGLPLAGICLEAKNADAPSIQIMLGGNDANAPLHLTRVISNVVRVTPQIGNDGRDTAIEIVDKKGEASLLMFQHRARMAAHA
jgi:hypothetical protein